MPVYTCNKGKPVEQLTDESLMKQIQADQLDACGLIYQRYKKELFGYFFNCSRKVTMSEDLVQATFEKFIKYRKNYTGKGSVKSWLFSIARNAYIDEYNRKKKYGSNELHEKLIIADPSSGSEEIMIQSERYELLHRAMNLLSAEERELLSLVKLNGNKYHEVAKQFDLNESTLKVKIFRIMNRLKKYMVEIKAKENY